MDLITHSALGAAVAITLAAPRYLRQAAVAGAVIALLPDVDIFLGAGDDPLQPLVGHRHFTHSLLMAPVVAGLLAMMSRFFRLAMPAGQFFLVALGAYISACLLDWCTAYGTHLLWPILPDAYALAIIAVVDPVFTLILIIGITLALWRRQKRAVFVALTAALLYLLLGCVQHWRALQEARQLADQRQLTHATIEVKPTLGNLLLWRSIMVDSQSNIYVDAIRTGAATDIYTGERGHLITPQQLQTLVADHPARETILRYQQQYAPLLIKHPDSPLMLGDARFSMLPDSLKPLWGLEVQENSVVFVTRRQQDREMRQHFLYMLLGKETRDH